MGFSSKLKEKVLVNCGRHCCICHKFCGTKIEVHHILQKCEGGADTFENAIPLCFDCHADMRSYDHKHPKGIKYTTKELTAHRDSWYKKIAGNIGIAGQETIVETDKIVYQRFLNILPWDGSINFLRTYNFAGWSFKISSLNDLSNYEYECSNPSFQFIDPDLEGMRVKLREHIMTLRGLIAIETFPTNSIGYNSVPSEWEIEQPERFKKVVNNIHKSASLICETYDNIINTAMRKLGILPTNMA